MEEIDKYINKQLRASPETLRKFIDSIEVDTLIECIKNLEINAIPIGEGGNAIIYISDIDDFKNACLKKIKEKPQINSNNIDEEHKYQMMARMIGVNTPLALFSFKSIENIEYLVMERINGNTVGDIVRNMDLLPINFNKEKFINSLKEQILKLHNAGIYHRDLHFDNVMINENGDAVIIDFGTATVGTGSDYTYEEGVSMYNNKLGHYEYVNGYFKDDDKMVKNIIASVMNFNNK